MNPVYFYNQLVLAHRPQARAERALADEVRDHFKKTLSVDTVVTQLRERLAKQHERDAILDAITTLERELRALNEDTPQIALIRQKIDEMKKKISTSPSP